MFSGRLRPVFFADSSRRDHFSRVSMSALSIFSVAHFGRSPKRWVSWVDKILQQIGGQVLKYHIFMFKYLHIPVSVKNVIFQDLTPTGLTPTGFCFCCIELCHSDSSCDHLSWSLILFQSKINGCHLFRKVN